MRRNAFVRASVIGAFFIALASVATSSMIDGQPRLIESASLGGATQQGQHLPFGPVRPERSLPRIDIRLDDGAVTDLRDATRGQWTLVQLMYSHCRTVCPIQGFLFSQIMQIIDKEDISLKLLSLSIDPERDGPVELAAWLQMFNAGKIWRAGAPTPQFSREFGLFFEVAKSVIDAHDARIFIITPVGTLSYITEDFPSPDAVVALIKEGMKMSETKSLP